MASALLGSQSEAPQTDIIKMQEDSAKVKDALMEASPKIKELLDQGFYVWTEEDRHGLLATYAQAGGLEFSIVATIYNGKFSGLTIVGDYKDTEKTSVTINHIYDLDGTPSKNIGINVSKNGKVVSQIVDTINVGAVVTQVKENENLYPEALKLLIALKSSTFDEESSRHLFGQMNGIWVSEKKKV